MNVAKTQIGRQSHNRIESGESSQGQGAGTCFAKPREQPFHGRARHLVRVAEALGTFAGAVQL
jgi:hypothetical protein